jgi:hypothetical protein
MGEQRYSYAILDSALDEGDWSNSRPSRYTHGKRAPRIHWIGGRVDPIAGLEAVE